MSETGADTCGESTSYTESTVSQEEQLTSVNTSSSTTSVSNTSASTAPDDAQGGHEGNIASPGQRQDDLKQTVRYSLPKLSVDVESC